MEEKDFKLLLDHVGLIDYKYQKVNEQDEFNVFSVIRNPNDEVNLHSRFLHELLNPESKHKQGDTFLNLFLNEVKEKLPSNFILNKPEVFREYKNIDILIKDTDYTIIIENKLDAGDQQLQLQRYYDLMKEENIKNIEIFYLTKDGHPPSDNSLGKLKEKEKVHTISYREDITAWLEKCIKEVSLFPILRETIKQYLNLIKELTGQTTTMEEKNEIFELFKKDDNYKKARLIANNWEAFKNQTQWNFWYDLKDILLKKEFKVSLNAKANRNSIEAIKSQITVWVEVDKMETGESIWLLIETSGNSQRHHCFYYGIRIMKNGETCDAADDKYNKMAENIINSSDKNDFKTSYDRNFWFIASSYNKKGVNLFEDRWTEELCIDNKRKEFIEEFIKDEIKPLLQRVKLALEKTEEKLVS